jgi:hypothetical protein
LLISKNDAMSPPKSSSHRLSAVGLLVACGALAILGCVIIRIFNARLGHDQISYLLEAQRLVSGDELYGPHSSETNPPLIVWFSAVPVLLARLVGGSPEVLLRAVVLAMLCGSVAWSVAILRRGAAAIVNGASLGILAFAIVVAEFAPGAFEFGQREHLLIILLLPYILAVVTGVVKRLSTPECCALGLCAGIAIWFKPHDVLIIVGLELFLALRARTLRQVVTPEFLSTVLTSALILMFVCIFTPLYGKQVLPLLFDTYWAMGTKSALPLAISLHKYMLFVFLMLLVLFFFRRFLHDPATSIALLISSIAASIAFDIQHSDWRYHRYPHEVLLTIAFSYLLIDLLSPSLGRLMADQHLLRRTVFAAVAVMAAVLCFFAIRPRTLFPPPDRTELEQFLAHYPPSTTVYAFSTGVPALSAAYNLHLNWGSRFAHMWMLPAIIQNEMGPTGPSTPFKRLPPKTLARLAALQRTESTEDLNYWRPSVVLVQHCNAEESCQAMEGKSFDTIAWLSESPDFAAAWSHYQRQPDAPTSYDLYVRVR